MTDLSAFQRLQKYPLVTGYIQPLSEYVRSAQDHELYQLNPAYLAQRLQWSLPQTLDVLTLAAAENLWRLEWAA